MENSKTNEDRFAKIILFFVLVVFPLVFASYLWWPQDEAKTQQEIKMGYEKAEFDSLFFPAKTNKIIKNLINNRLPISKNKFGKIEKNFYCIRVNKHSNKIEPFNYLNEKFRKSGFKITTNPDSLQYVIIGKTTRYNFGNYTDGTNAYRLKDNIIIYDLKNELAYNVRNEIGGEPPTQIRGYHGKDNFAVGSSWEDEIYLQESLKFVIK